MGRKAEPLTGGLITDRDPAFLEPGQLSDIRNLVYKNGGGALERATGRAVFGAVSAVATGVWGLRDMHFDNADHYLIGAAGTKYRTAPVGDTGSFTDLATIATQGSGLEVVQYRNRFFLMNGTSGDASAIGTNVVAYLSATATGTPPSTRQHGMLPVIAAPAVSTGSGGFSQSVTGYYEYWTTEVARLTQDGAQFDLESAYSSDNGVTTVFVSSTGVAATITMPSPRNAITTHWNIYRSPKKDKASDKAFPTGFLVAQLSTATASHADTSAQASASSFPASFNGSGYFFGWASASSMVSDNGVYASGTVASFGLKEQGSYGFTLGGFSGSVQGIVVEVQGYVSSGSAPVPLTVTIGKRRADGGFVNIVSSPGGAITIGAQVASKSGLISSTASASPTTLSLGSSTDRWFPTDKAGLSDTDFDGNFMVVLGFSKPLTSVGVDYLKVYVYYGSSVDSTVVFPTVVYTFGDITSQVAKNFPPPSSSTGDLFQDSLVVNDVSNPSLVRYSFPGEPEYFPPTYYVDMETKENDRVTAIRTVNNRILIGMRNSMIRMNYLPTERDSDFNRGQAIDIVSKNIGCYNERCMCTFTIDGQSEQVAWVSDKGIHTSDAYNYITRTKNQNWRNFISLSSTSNPIALLNDPETRCLRFYYRNDSLGNETYMCLHLSYDRADIDKDGNFKVSGPVHMRNYEAGGGGYASLDSVWALPRTSGNTGFYFGYGGASASAGSGKVWFETGTTIPSNDTTCQYTTRCIYAAGLSGEWMLDDLYGYCGSYSGAPVVTYTFKGRKTNDTGETSRGSKSITLGGQSLHHVSPKVQVEGLRITMQATASAFSQEELVLGSTVYGTEDSGR